jgi:hypothetical protein
MGVIDVSGRFGFAKKPLPGGFVALQIARQKLQGDLPI